MQKNSMKKIGALLSGGLIIAYFITVILAYTFIPAPLMFIAIMSVVYGAIGVVLIYCIIERFKEIDEGLDDAVEHY